MQRAGGLALAVVLSMGLAACGDGGDSTSEATTTTTEGEPTDDTGVELDDITAECAALVAAFAGASAGFGSLIGGAPAGDLEGAAEYFEDVAGQLPDEVRADFEIFAEALSGYAEVLAEAEVDFSDPSSLTPEKLAELESLFEGFDNAEIEEATANIEAYLEASCDGA